MTAWDPSPGVIGSGSAYRHWYRYWYGVGEAPAPRFLQPYIVTAADAATLATRVAALEQAAGDGERISLPLRGRAGEVACAQFHLASITGTAIDGVIDNSMPLPRSGEGTKRAPQPYLDPAGIERIVAVIDSEIAFAHPRFRRNGKTAIAWYWDQDADAYDRMLTRTDDADLSRFGREMDAAQIDRYVQDHGRNERALYEAYRRDSYVDPLFALPPSRYAHGTSVLDAAAGDLVADDERLALFAVQLPRFAVGQTQGHFLEVYLRLALERISELADRIGVDRVEQGLGVRPDVFVNISVGGHAGRHDGQSRLERLMDRMIGDGEVRSIFLPAGNSRETRTHARYRAEDWQSPDEELVWRILPDDGTPSFLEIWLPDTSGGVGLTVESPSGLAQQWSQERLIAGEFFELADKGEVLARLYVEDDPQVGLPGGPVTPRRRIVLAVRQTARSKKAALSRLAGRPELAGEWRIRLDTTEMTSPHPIITAWVSRDEPIFRLRTGGRQSFFPGPPIDEDAPPHSGVVRDGSLSDLATGQRTMVVGAVRGSDLKPADYSAEGIAKDDAVADRDIFPTLSAEADKSSALPGVLTVGYFAGSHSRLNGTSVAAPVALNRVLRAALDAKDAGQPHGTDPFADVQQSARDLVATVSPEGERKRLGHGALRRT